MHPGLLRCATRMTASQLPSDGTLLPVHPGRSNTTAVYLADGLTIGGLIQGKTRRIENSGEPIMDNLIEFSGHFTSKGQCVPFDVKISEPERDEPFRNYVCRVVADELFFAKTQNCYGASRFQ